MIPWQFRTKDKKECKNRVKASVRLVQDKSLQVFPTPDPVACIQPQVWVETGRSPHSPFTAADPRSQTGQSWPPAPANKALGGETLLKKFITDNGYSWSGQQRDKAMFQSLTEMTTLWNIIEHAAEKRKTMFRHEKWKKTICLIYFAECYVLNS